MARRRGAITRMTRIANREPVLVDRDDRGVGNDAHRRAACHPAAIGLTPGKLSTNSRNAGAADLEIRVLVEQGATGCGREIVYRRDIASSAPDRVQVRVIAKVVRAMAFSKAGQTAIASLEDQWTIRGNSYELRVAPVPENAEMLTMRPQNREFVFPAGRYGLVLKDLAYDFSVAGPITDAAQCLERTEAANGGFYSECRSPSSR
jgi:hypothetical protein